MSRLLDRGEGKASLAGDGEILRRVINHLVERSQIHALDPFLAMTGLGQQAGQIGGVSGSKNHEVVGTKTSQGFQLPPTQAGPAGLR